MLQHILLPCALLLMFIHELEALVQYKIHIHNDPKFSVGTVALPQICVL